MKIIFLIMILYLFYQSNQIESFQVECPERYGENLMKIQGSPFDDLNRGFTRNPYLYVTELIKYKDNSPLPVDLDFFNH